MPMHEDPVLTAEKIGVYMEKARNNFQRFFNRPDPDAKKNSKFGKYDEWLEKMKRENITQYEEYMKRYEEMEQRQKQ